MYIRRTRQRAHLQCTHTRITRLTAAKRADSLLAAIATRSGRGGVAVVGPAQRRQLSLTLLAAFDLHSAILQWSYLADSTERSGSEIPADIAAFLTQQLATPIERVSVGVALGRRLGLQRIEAIDDQQQNDIIDAIGPELGRGLKGNALVATAVNAPLYAESQRRMISAAAAGDLLPYYLYLNSTEYMTADLETQWALSYRTHLASGVDRANAAAWEIRNLNIASNIRRASARAPGKRMLVIIGASHKAFLDAYLSAMIDVKLVQLSDLAP